MTSSGLLCHRQDTSWGDNHLATKLSSGTYRLRNPASLSFFIHIMGVNNYLPSYRDELKVNSPVNKYV